MLSTNGIWEQQMSWTIITAIRKYPLKYDSGGGFVERHVSLRDCFVFVMRNSLVTLTEKSNPEPGESRTGQVDTMQGTDLGIPKDSLIVSRIHMDNNCDGLHDVCPCLAPRVLNKEDFKTLITPTPKEEEQIKKFKQLCRWGLQNIWSKIKEDNVLSDLIQAVPQEPSTPQHADNNELEISFRDLNISGIEMEDYDEASNDDADLHDIQAALAAVSHHNPVTVEDMSEEMCIQVHDSDFEDTLSNMESSVEKEGITPFEDDDTQKENENDQVAGMNFVRYRPPPFLLFRTAPWIGRDDDPKIVKGFLNDLLVMADVSEKEYAILGVDQKIGGVHMKLEKTNCRFRKVIREIPPLHLQKMKMLNSAVGIKMLGLSISWSTSKMTREKMTPENFLDWTTWMNRMNSDCNIKCYMLHTHSHATVTSCTH